MRTVEVMELLQLLHNASLKTDQFNSPKTGTETLIYFLSYAYAAPLEMKLNYMYIHIVTSHFYY
jgi:hypothetical protein